MSDSEDELPVFGENFSSSRKSKRITKQEATKEAKKHISAEYSGYKKTEDLFNRLVSSKKMKEDQNSKKMYEELKPTLSSNNKGRVGGKTKFSEIDLDENSLSQMETNADLTSEQKSRVESMSNVKNLPDVHPGEDVFVKFRKTCKAIPKFKNPCLQSKQEKVENGNEKENQASGAQNGKGNDQILGNAEHQKLFSLLEDAFDDHDLLYELFCGGWLLNRFCYSPALSLASKWIFSVMVYCQDELVCAAAARLLADIYSSNSNGQNLWVPSVKGDILKAVHSFGATEESLSRKGVILDVMKHTSAINSESSNNAKEPSPKKTDSNDDMPEVPFTSVYKKEDFSSWPVINFTKMCQFIRIVVKTVDEAYSAKDVRRLIILLERCIIDPKMCYASFEAQLAVMELLNSIPESQYTPKFQKSLIRVFLQLSDSHDNMVHLVRYLPPTPRGTHLQCQISWNMLRKLNPRRLLKRQSETGSILSLASFSSAKSTESPSSVCSTPLMRTSSGLKGTPGSDLDSIKLKDITIMDLLSVVNTFSAAISNETNYSELRSIIHFLDICISNVCTLKDRPPTDQEHAQMVNLQDTLQLSHGKIRDNGAAFLDRTKVKDCILHLVSKLDSLNKRKEQKQSLINEHFTKPATSTAHTPTQAFT
eukprot:Nk52_evm12s266 gene=Nk52_evmTU12s266